MAQDVIVETRNLTKVYRDFWGRRKKTALNALNITIDRGEIFGLLGPNGSGKTTTIKLLLGLLFPTSGEAFVFGESSLTVSQERTNRLPAGGVVPLPLPECGRDARFLRSALRDPGGRSPQAGE